MKISVTVRLDRPLTEAAEIARRAEELGFSGVWVADHYFHRDATGALALMAAATNQVTLGTAVTSPLLRHPALLASTAASLTEVSDGRFILGLGAGGYEFGSELGLPIRRPLGLTRETVNIVRSLANGTTTVEGDTFAVTGAGLRFQASAAPVYLAARGPKMLRLAGEVSDGVITHGLSAAHIRFVTDQLDAAESGRRPQVVLMLDVQVDNDRDRAVDALRGRCLTMAGGSYADELIEIYGLDPDAVARLRAAVRSGDRATATALVTDDMVDAFAIGGSPAHLADRLSELDDLAVDEVILSTDGGDLDSATNNLTELAKAVIR
ncbi:LLM class flavin-dependent oxidoreductase [Amycolatopsis taiwanensis]|uniref:5,10-methylenetetrahydromethanopterin reductase n=1 Tax=Amycolatopsis taiwanensis TaxID=342230 RepID=A0A9W6RCT9_9PSEU|nr:LLM class flavin-dependent oxidoreductase [Amycolatopsis taiwanensis]GLY71697.1 5,10-methylenetetrahydromethanopterin reductase [Amycolatopsis taiwanensis]